MAMMEAELVQRAAFEPRRLSDMPVVRPGAVDGYDAIFNPGVVVHDGRYHLFARGVRSGYRRNTTGSGPRFFDYVSDVLVFTSADGLDYQFEYVLAYSSPNDVYCFEDPRVQLVRSGGEDHWIMTYTNLPEPDSGRPWRIGAHKLTYDGTRFQLDGPTGSLLGPDGIANKDAVIFNLADGRVAMIHRIHPDMQVAVFDSLDELWNADDTYWAEHVRCLSDHAIIRPTPGALGVGAGAPPITTDEGLLLFFHERNAAGTYTMNVALLDAGTGRVRAMIDDAIFRPELDWELVGDVDDVVFVQGAHRHADGMIYLTYGAADRAIGAAEVSEAHLLNELRRVALAA
jgi:beta-1,2-mannobiose phosphorylase / 1,2-beta-oligomannan phosphorylase